MLVICKTNRIGSSILSGLTTDKVYQVVKFDSVRNIYSIISDDNVIVNIYPSDMRFFYTPQEVREIKLSELLCQ